jgi:AraC family transcriptional activator of tynA and feaB
VRETIESQHLHPSPDLDVNVCDTEYCSLNKGFPAFRDAISSAFMPWMLEYKSEMEFDGRMTWMASDSGTIARVKMSPVIAVRRNAEIAKSSLDCFYANYVLAGDLAVEQSGRTATAKRGDIVVYDSNLPVKITERSTGLYEDLAFRIPKAKLIQVQAAYDLLNNVVIPADKMIAPLSSCLAFLSQNLLTASSQELGALYDMCTTLLPVAAGHSENRGELSEEAPPSNYYTRELIEFINSNIGNTELSPRSAADHLGISVRYVHKQFAARGTTFGTYVMAKRLDLVRHDLISEASRHQPIFVLAYRWGFNDLSTFIRAFKKKFGCSPRQYRFKF